MDFDDFLYALEKVLRLILDVATHLLLFICFVNLFVGEFDVLFLHLTYLLFLKWLDEFLWK